MIHPEEKNIILECQKNNRAAQAALYNQYASILFKICLRYSNSRENAEDLLSEVFIIIFNQIDTYKFQGSFEGWLKRITINIALNKIKSDAKKSLISLDCFSHDFFPDTSPNIISDLSAEEILKIVHQLPPRYRAVFCLYAVDGFSHQEISEMLEISVGTSKSNLHDAKLILQKKIRTQISIPIAAYELLSI